MKERVVFLNVVNRNRYNIFSAKATIAFCILFCGAVLVLMGFAVTFSQMVPRCQKPNIVLIIADDMGWNDIGFHGSNEIPTPNIDALAYHGAILNRHYTQSVCSPSRASLLTGKYPIRMGMQGNALPFSTPVSLPLNETIMPQYLKRQGYSTNLIGKWHLGYYMNSTTPTERGYDSFFGYYGGWLRYNDSKTIAIKTVAFDARRNFERAGDEFVGKYSTDVYTDEAIRVISSHDQSKPLFLQVAYSAVHGITNGLLQVRNYEENEKQFAYIKGPYRRLFAGALTALDESVGRIIQSLDENELLDNTVVVFMSDNGGESVRGLTMTPNFGSNWPLRGMKGSLLEGGVHCAAAIWSPMLQQNVVLSNKVHLSDWVQTFSHIAGGGEVSNIDGINQWPYLAGDNPKEPRNEVLVNIDEEKKTAALIVGDWKIVVNVSSKSRDYYSYSGRNIREYDMDGVLSSSTHHILSKYARKTLSENDFWRSRNASLVDDKCEARLQLTNEEANDVVVPCFNSSTTCLFNLKEDACEFTDLSANYPSKLEELKNILEEFERQVVPQWKGVVDPAADPKYYGDYVSPWVC